MYVKKKIKKYILSFHNLFHCDFYIVYNEEVSK